MAKINIKKAGTYTQQNNGGGYFTLKDDGDMATVRFLYEETDGSDMDYYLVHEVEIDGKRRYINCLGVDDEGRMHPADCPLCKSGNKAKEKLFLQLYDEGDNTVKIWERGQTFVAKIISFINRYGSLVKQGFEIERRGKKGSTNTTYEMFPLQADGKTMEDFPQKQEIVGTLVMDATKQDMYDIIDGTYQNGNKRDEQPKQEEQQFTRRNRRRESGDAF